MIINGTQNEMRELASTWIEKDEPLVVELGCSDGNFANLLNEKGITNYIGIDILSKKIKVAKKKFPNFIFIDCDITKNLHLLKEVTAFVSFQCLEHIEYDLNVLTAIPLGCRMIISVPNSAYKGHVRFRIRESQIKDHFYLEVFVIFKETIDPFDNMIFRRKLS